MSKKVRDEWGKEKFVRQEKCKRKNRKEIDKDVLLIVIIKEKKNKKENKYNKKEGKRENRNPMEIGEE